jgi:ATP-grasp domain, R2K clade family 3
MPEFRAMHWILQNNIFSETGWDTLVETLIRFNIPFSEHKVVPFIGELQPEAQPDSENVICFGSYAMRHIANRKAWRPGVFDVASVTFLEQKQRWGKLMLNYDGEVVEFKDAVLEQPKFVRPIDDSKVFAGRVMEPASFHEMQEKALGLEEDHEFNARPNTLVQICEPKTIYSECRFWIVKGEVVTASQYKVGSRVLYNSNVEYRFHEFTASVLGSSERWLPAEAFVLDVCDTPHGIRIVEINTINSAGFYAADVQKLVFALEREFSR